MNTVLRFLTRVSGKTPPTSLMKKQLHDLITFALGLLPIITNVMPFSG